MKVMAHRSCKVLLASSCADKGLVWRDLSKLEE
jgi:hypothetical protein